MNRFISTVLMAALLLAAGSTGAQISLRSTAQGGAESGDLTLLKPAGTNTGDVLIAAISVTPGSRTVAAPSGWVQVSSANNTGVRLAVFTRVVPAGDGAVSAYVFTIAGGAHAGAAGGIAAFIGVDQSAPVDVSGAQGTAAAFSHAAPSVTATVRGAQLVAVFTMPGATDDWQPPTGMLEVIDVASVAVRPTAAGVALTLAVEPRSAPGATGSRTATADGTGISAAAGRTASLLLRPALAPANTQYRLDGATGSMSGVGGEVFDSGDTALHGFRRIITNPSTTNFVAPNPTIADQVPQVTGQFCNAASFDGRSVLQVPASPLFDYTTELSASAWIFPTASPGGGGLASVLSNDQNYEFHLNSERRLWWWWGGGARELSSATQIPLNQWTHVAITFRSVAGSARQRIYINGVLDTNTNAWAGTLTPNGCNFYIGGDVSTGTGCALMPERAFRGNIDEVKVYNYELTLAEVARDRTLGRSCTTPVTRYQIEHDGVANSCAAESVTVRACANADCSSLSSNGASGTVVAGGNSVPFSIPVGQTSTTVSILVPTTTGPPDPETVQFGIGSVSPVPALVPLCRNGVGAVDSLAACGTRVSDSGFVIDVPDHVSDTLRNVSVRAVQRTAGLGCVPLFASVTRNVGLWTSYADPATGTRAVNLGGASLGFATPGTPISLAFDANGVAATTVRYADAGAVRLQARYVGTAAGGDGGLVVSGEDRFVARPSRFDLTLPAYDAATAGQPADATRPVFWQAGVPFAASVRALNASGNVTPNFGREVSPERVRFESDLVAPAGGNNPAPVIASGLSAFVNGVSSGTLRWDEVGVMTLRPRLASAPYIDFVDSVSPLLTGDVVGTAFERVGRFIPARLGVTPNVPVLLDACAAGNVTYVGQDFGFGTAPELAVRGQNALGGTTLNYVNGSGAANAFWRFGGALAGRSYVNEATSATLPALSRTTSGGNAAVTENIAAPFDGTGRVRVAGDRLTYAKPTAPEAPFTALMRLLLPAADLTDSDGACFDPDANGSCDPYEISGITGAEQRWGRLALENAFGPEVLDLRVPMRAEYFDGSVFRANAADVCSMVSAMALADANAADALLPSETCVQDAGSPGASGLGCSAAGPVVRRYTATPPVGAGGAYTLWLRAPGAGNAGVLDLTPAVPAWLLFNWTGSGPSAPTARVGFGVFQGDRRAIHEREVY